MNELKIEEKRHHNNQPNPIPQANKKKRKLKKNFWLNHIGTITVITAILVWELLYQTEILNPIFFSSP